MAEYNHFARIHPDVAPDHVDYHVGKYVFTTPPPGQPWLGWQNIDDEMAKHLRGIVQNAANPTNSPRVFQVVTKSEYEYLVREERKSGGKNLDPVSIAQMNDMSAEIANLKDLLLSKKEDTTKDEKIAALEASNQRTEALLQELLLRLPAPVQTLAKVEPTAEIEGTSKGEPDAKNGTLVNAPDAVAPPKPGQKQKPKPVAVEVINAPPLASSDKPEVKTDTKPQ